MSDYVTRIARAIKDAGGSLDMDGRLGPDDVRELCIDMARAALLAALDPDEAMIEAGLAELSAISYDEFRRDDVVRIFRAMIKRALEEK